MKLNMARSAWPLALLAVALLAAPLGAQSTTGSFQGTITDEQDALVPGANITVRNVDTNARRLTVTDVAGRWRVSNLPIGNYEVTVDLPGFARVVRSGLTLALNQDAVVDLRLKAATQQETVTVTADAPLLNTTTPEVGVRFDTKRVAELPVGSSRDVFSLALSAAGVSETNSGQASFASGPDFAANGMRARSNNFMIDGQDSNDVSVTGRVQQINNTDIVQEVRLITNQFAAEYGRAAGSVFSVVTKSGTNAFHGSGFFFTNRDELNTLSNLDKAAGLTQPPPWTENQYGFTLGGPIVKDKTFFFGSYQRWTQKGAGTGFTLNGAPTEAGRAVLQQFAASRPQIAALLKFLPAAQTPIGKSASFTVGGQTYSVPLGAITGSAAQFYNDDQFSGRIDQKLGANHTLAARYLLNDDATGGTGQVTPGGLTTLNVSKTHSAALWLTSTLRNDLVNEVRFGFVRLQTNTSASDPSSEEIPSLEINELGLIGFNAGPTRSAIGLAVNLPQWRNNEVYQIQDNLAYYRGKHSFKVGFDLRRTKVESFFN